jgi:RNA recognition motif-containing protein
VVGEGGGGGGGGSGGSGDDSLEVSAETSQASPAASPDRERVVSSNDSNMSDGPTVVERQSSQAPPAREYRGANTFAVYVEGLPPNFDDNNLKQLFDPFVDISSCKIKPGAIGYSTKIGFVNFRNEQDAETAIQNVNGQQVEGYTIQARHKPPKSR